MHRIVFLFLLLPFGGWSQSEDPKWFISGYVKDMVTLNHSDSTLVDNLIHHRLNLAWFPTSSFTGRLEIRNRIFFGDLVRSYPDYSKFIDVNNDYLDLSLIPVNQNGLVFHTMIDRLNFAWTESDWEITLGRQRLNWGVNLVWNPNDLFNSYSFFDFDYEERPGSDALRIRKYTGVASEVEWAIKAADRWELVTTAIKYQFNYRNYDLQFIGGIMQNNLALGHGWAGSIGGAGLKGEVTYLHHLQNTASGWLGSVSMDFMFPNSIYLNGSFLYNSYGSRNANLLLIDPSSRLDIRSMSPFKWSTFMQAAYPIFPLLNVSLSSIYFPEDNSLFFNPAITYSIVSNLDVDLIGQFFLNWNNERPDWQSEVVFLRLKLSY